VPSSRRSCPERLAAGGRRERRVPLRGVPGGTSDVFAAYEHEGRVTLLVGDIVGQGVAASMLAAVAKGASRPRTAPRSRSCSRSSTARSTAPVRAAPRCVAWRSHRPGGRRGAGGGAGAPFPYVVSSAGGKPEVRSLIARGPLIGTSRRRPSPRRRCRSAPTRRSSSSPGLIQAESPARQAYGERRLLRVLRKSAASGKASLVDDLVEDLDKFVARGAVRDEVLLVVARPVT